MEGDNCKTGDVRLNLRWQFAAAFGALVGAGAADSAQQGVGMGARRRQADAAAQHGEIVV